MIYNSMSELVDYRIYLMTNKIPCPQIMYIFINVVIKYYSFVHRKSYLYLHKYVFTYIYIHYTYRYKSDQQDTMSSNQPSASIHIYTYIHIYIYTYKHTHTDTNRTNKTPCRQIEQMLVQRANLTRVYRYLNMCIHFLCPLVMPFWLDLCVLRTHID
jgi:hypothetical protein